MKICHIVCAGDKDVMPSVGDEDIVIAVDGGYRYCTDEGILPEEIIGDFDSLGHIPDGKNVIVMPVRKDETDTYFAVRYALERGYRKIRLYCAAGGSAAHTFANIQTLIYISEAGGEGEIVTGREILTVIKNSEIKFPPRSGGKISVFSLSDISSGVDICGLDYEVRGATLTSSYPVGEGNGFIGKCARVRVENGILLIVYDV